MPIQIKIKGNKETNEYQDALQLKQLFESSIDINSTNGEILIISNATLFGQKTKDIDLVVIGNLEKYNCKIKTKARSKEGEKEIELELEERHVYVNNFCFVIETKRHRAEDIRLEGLNLSVKYNDKYSNATTQSENQKYSLKNFFIDTLNYTPYICNFIWFRNVNWDSIKILFENNKNLYTKHNYLPATFKFPFLLQLACVQNAPYNYKDNNKNYKGYVSFNCLKKNEVFDYPEIDRIFNIFEKVKQGVGNLTRKKIELITNKLLATQQYAQAIGEKLVIISGRAGTGKTVKLLRIACDLAINKGARSLILTYNHALVSDIRRTLALAEIPDGVDNYTVNITTLHNFFHELVLLVLNSKNPEQGMKHIPDFFTKYAAYLQNIIDSINNRELTKNVQDKITWDYILIDEAQDWGDLEKKIIFTIFGKEKIIVADGIDQLVRSQKKCNWTQGLKPNIDFNKTYEKRGLRQKANLISFVNEYAKQTGITWEIEPKPELIGGKIIITTKGYTKALHDEQLKYCKDYQNSEYEMMFLVPPSLVDRKYDEKHIETRKFSLTNDFLNMGISIHDLTNKDLRIQQYAIELTQHRLLQYDSCRGLEGWTVVCLELDEFVHHKMTNFKDEQVNELALETFEEKRNRFVYLWSLIPLTRAIDTLVITIKNRNSNLCKHLWRVYERYPDFIQWID